MVADFTNLPFPDESFPLVIFDPPHLNAAGLSGWLAKKYGKLDEDWERVLAAGFRECFRVLKSKGTLIFKWNETQIPVSDILKLTTYKPLVGNKCGKQSKTHWIVFMKP
jgi:ubiquinone/menaquinone biosynthesis C-methylase UbiE